MGRPRPEVLIAVWAGNPLVRFGAAASRCYGEARDEELDVIEGVARAEAVGVCAGGQTVQRSLSLMM